LWIGNLNLADDHSVDERIGLFWPVDSEPVKSVTSSQAINGYQKSFFDR